MPLATEERERRAYIEGNVEMAAVLGGEIDAFQESLSEVEHERDQLQSEVNTLEQQLEEKDDELEKVETELAKAREILDLA